MVVNPELLELNPDTAEITGRNPEKYIHFDPAAAGDVVELEGKFTVRELYQIVAAMNVATKQLETQTAPLEGQE